MITCYRRGRLFKRVWQYSTCNLKRLNNSLPHHRHKSLHKLAARYRWSRSTEGRVSPSLYVILTSSVHLVESSFEVNFVRVMILCYIILETRWSLKTCLQLNFVVKDASAKTIWFVLPCGDFIVQPTYPRGNDDGIRICKFSSRHCILTLIYHLFFSLAKSGFAWVHSKIHYLTTWQPSPTITPAAR